MLCCNRKTFVVRRPTCRWLKMSEEDTVDCYLLYLKRNKNWKNFISFLLDGSQLEKKIEKISSQLIFQLIQSAKIVSANLKKSPNPQTTRYIKRTNTRRGVL